MSTTTFKRCVILRENTIHKYRDIARIDLLPILEQWTPKDNVVSLPFTRSVQGIDQWWIDAVDGRSKAIGISWVLIIIQHLHFHLPHQEDTAVTTPLAIAFHLTRRTPFEVKLAVSELFLAANVTTAWHALQNALFHFPLGRFSRLLVCLPFFNLFSLTSKQNNGVRGWIPGPFLRTESPWLDPHWLRPIHVMNRPGMRGIRCIPVKTTFGQSRRGEKSQCKSVKRE